MKRLWDPILKSADDLQDAAKQMLESSVSYFKTKLGSFSLLSSSEAVVGGDRDETHYFLVPGLLEENNYCLYRTRVLPDGVGPENDLPKARIFQLPSTGAQAHLTALLAAEFKDAQLQDRPSDSAFANRLDLIADEIDHQSNRVSGGLILIGGVVAIANPVLGVGIAAKSLIPGLGSKLTTHGVKQASDWLRKRGEKSADADAEQSARAQVQKLKPEVRENQLLRILETTLHSRGGDFDPFMESQDLWECPEDLPNLRLGIDAISVVYHDRGMISPLLDSWITHLEEIRSSQL